MRELGHGLCEAGERYDEPTARGVQKGVASVAAEGRAPAAANKSIGREETPRWVVGEGNGKRNVHVERKTEENGENDAESNKKKEKKEEKNADNQPGREAGKQAGKKARKLR